MALGPHRDRFVIINEMSTTHFRRTANRAPLGELTPDTLLDPEDIENQPPDWHEQQQMSSYPHPSQVQTPFQDMTEVNTLGGRKRAWERCENRVRELIHRYNESKPSRQFHRLSRKVEERLFGRSQRSVTDGTSQSTYAQQIVKDGWIDQGIWRDEWIDSIPSEGVFSGWKHEDEAYGLEDGPLGDSSIYRTIGSVPPLSHPQGAASRKETSQRKLRNDASRPLNMFIAEVAFESDMTRDPSPDTIWTPIASISDGLNTKSYYEVKKQWQTIGLWNDRWGVLPGTSWYHETSQGDRLRQDLCPCPYVNDKLLESDIADALPLEAHFHTQDQHESEPGSLGAFLDPSLRRIRSLTPSTIVDESQPAFTSVRETLEAQYPYSPPAWRKAALGHPSIPPFHHGSPAGPFAAPRHLPTIKQEPRSTTSPSPPFRVLSMTPEPRPTGPNAPERWVKWEEDVEKLPGSPTPVRPRASSPRQPNRYIRALIEDDSDAENKIPSGKGKGKERVLPLKVYNDNPPPPPQLATSRKKISPDHVTAPLRRSSRLKRKATEDGDENVQTRAKRSREEPTVESTRIKSKRRRKAVEVLLTSPIIR
ncbi:hypothetical protein GGS20DRAFT_61566 [Poronia punctata]|nr:hypothetical protein GGS20DRAFT_61566 [Poronia punctata]